MDEAAPKPKRTRKKTDVQSKLPVAEVSVPMEITPADMAVEVTDAENGDIGLITGLMEKEFGELEEMLNDRLTTKDFFNAVNMAMEDRFKDIRHAILESTMVDVAMMREDFKSYCNDIEKDVDTMDAIDVLESFKTFMIDIENVLFRNGVEIFKMPEYEKMHHKIDKVTMTDDPAMDMKVRESFSDGYTIDSKVIYPERVDIYRFKGE